MSKMGQLSSRTKEIIFRVWGAACAAGLGYVTINNISMLGGWENPWCLGAYVAFVVASAIIPHIGLALSAIALGAALFAHEAYIAGIVLIIGTGAWWFTTGKSEDYSANATFSPTLFGIIGFSQIAPLLIGLRGKPGDAVRSSIYAALLAFILAGFGSGSLQTWQVGVGAPSGEVYNGVLFGMLSNVNTWVFLATWIVSGWVTAMIASNGNRIYGVIGVLCGFGILFLGGCAAMLLQTGGISWMPSMTYLTSAVITTVIAVVVAILIDPTKA